MIRHWLRWVWPPRAPELADAGRRGEHVIARIRFWLVAVLLVVPVASVLRDPAEIGSWIGVALLSLILVVAALVVRLTRGDSRPWMGFATSAFDITAVSVFHIAIMRAGDLPMALNSRVTFALYLLALTATALRYDGRICTFAGLLAVGQWVGLVAWAERTGLAARVQQAGRFYGDTHVAGQTEEVVIILLTASLAGVIVSRARALRLSATRDSLTRIHNRAYFEERLADELERARRRHLPLALALIDIDHFKRVNDTWGHPAGDAVLCAVASRLRAAVRSTDLVARLGGEEFVIAFPETSLAAAHARMEVLRRLVEAMAVDGVPAAPGAITISAGLAMYPDDATEGYRVIEAADQRLLAAKSAGRNCVQPAMAGTGV